MSVNPIIWLLLMITAVMVFFILFFPIAHSDDSEDPGWSIWDQILERAREWNIQKAINETLALADRFK